MARRRGGAAGQTGQAGRPPIRLYIFAGKVIELTQDRVDEIRACGGTLLPYGWTRGRSGRWRPERVPPAR